MQNYEALFEDEGDIFAGSPRSKFWDIFNQLSSDVAHEKFHLIMLRIAAMEQILMKQIGEEELEGYVRNYIMHNSFEVDSHAKSLYMEYAGELLYAMNA